jgi:hypothetical protein
MDIIPVSQFDNVPLLDKTDRVEGGLLGASNKQAASLANRTQWLKDAIDALEGGGGPFDYDASTGTPPAAGTGSGPGGAIQRKDQFVVSVAGVVSGTPLQVGDSLIAKQNLPTTLAHYVIIQGNATLATSSALGLVKLSQDLALGPQPDVVLSLVGLINLFAQLASPSFSGNPKAPTKPQTDRSDNLATTAHVGAAIDAETAVRTAAIGSETSARIDQDNILTTALNTERTQRQNSDNSILDTINGNYVSLDTRISNEIANRSNGDNNLQTQINSFDESNVPWVAASGFAAGYSSSGSYPLQIRKVRGVVQFRGKIDKSSTHSSGDLIMTLPAGYRPIASRVPRILVAPSSVIGGVFFLDIAPNGFVTMWEMGKSSGQPCSNNSAHLDNVSFDVAH